MPPAVAQLVVTALEQTEATGLCDVACQLQADFVLKLLLIAR
jgi:hypothetical protein